MKHTNIMSEHKLSLAAEICNLTLKFPGEQSLIFKDLSFVVPKGQKVLLLGPSGCGKSTLLQVLSGIIPNSIELPLKYDRFTPPASWGFVFQDPDTQFCMPYVDEELGFVLENLNVPRELMDQKILAALDSVGLKLAHPHTEIQLLSQGMKQRLALASILLLEPDTLFLDEPSALLDPEGAELIWETVKKHAEQKTVVIVEHQISYIADWVDRIVLFDGNGAIIADDSPSVIFNNYKSQFIEHGIWYPDVWHDYMRTDNYARIVKARSRLLVEHPAKLPNPANNDGLELLHFSASYTKGYSGNQSNDISPSIFVEQAAALTGEWIAICGENGAGKSTLLLSLMQLIETKGYYTIYGELVEHRDRTNRFLRRKTPRSSLLKMLSFVFQNPEMQFVTNRIDEEISLALKLEQLEPNNIEDRTKELLQLFQLDAQRHRHPYQLSIGQKRRLSVAAALSHKPSILLLDEPTFGQDARSTFAILELLEQLRTDGTIIIMITHDLYIMNHFATEIWQIAQGKLTVKKPPTDEISGKKGELALDEAIPTS